MKLNERLNIVIPIYTGTGDVEEIVAYVHSIPISREVFEANFLLVSKTFAAIYSEGLGEIAGPRVASLILAKVAERNKDPEGAMSLMNEIRRLSNVLVRGPEGWTTMPLQDAIDGGRLDSDDASEVLNALVFFIVVSAMHRRTVLKEMLPGAVKLWGAQISSLDFMAFAASLKTSIKAVNTGAKQQVASSVAY